MNESIYTTTRKSKGIQRSYDNRVSLPQIKQNAGKPDYDDSIS